MSDLKSPVSAIRITANSVFFDRNQGEIPQKPIALADWQLAIEGEASYFKIVVRDKVKEDAAWYYPEPKEAAKEIKNYVAFYKGVH